MEERTIRIRSDGSVIALYDDDSFLPEGRIRISRASSVEPDPKGGWRVILSRHPVLGGAGGRVLARRVPKRRDALALEVEAINGILLEGKEVRRGKGKGNRVYR